MNREQLSRGTTARLAAAIETARKHLSGFDGPHGGMSPDGYGEAAAAAAALREVLAAAEPENWCPPHFYNGRSTNVRGEAVFTCHLCGHSFTGLWKDDHDGYSEVPGGDTTP